MVEGRTFPTAAHYWDGSVLAWWPPTANPPLSVGFGWPSSSRLGSANRGVRLGAGWVCGWLLSQKVNRETDPQLVLESRLSNPGLWHLFCGSLAFFQNHAQNIFLVSLLLSVEPSTHTMLR